MDCEIIKDFLSDISKVNIATLIATVSAVIAAASAFFSYRLSKRIYDEIKSDEALVASKLQHPNLQEYDHYKSVLYFTLLNKSHRKVTITSIKAFDRKNNEIEIKWSSSIDSLGNIKNSTGLLGLKDSTEIFIRRNDGESYFITTFHIKHSFDETELVLDYSS
ncbi:hypothetical protein Q4488_18550 [Amphritea sp. 1_MG-2023]|uniref:hypothetical protein n=1 Tax=Amphritea sp. 1_MG-2023 TaxID=3062670 RepID=UPI0026E2441D|nr:hypothetical protein [Amphritea sp. 1_MG-2023]MDO6565376.1 hypothetical protein [Amphritea sp. 1_MG-2023]